MKRWVLNSVMCFACFTAATFVYLLLNEPTRAAVFDFKNRYAVEIVGYILGAGLWFSIPGMINYWIARPVGYINWLKFSTITVVCTFILICIFFDSLTGRQTMYFMMIMTIPTTIAQIIVLRGCMGLSLSKPTYYIETDVPDEVTVIVPEAMTRTDPYRRGE